LDGKLDLITLRNNEWVIYRLGFKATDYLYSLFFFSMSKKPPTNR